MKFALLQLLALILLLGFPLRAVAGWTLQKSGTLAWLKAVYFIDEQRGWAAGSNGTILETEDGGVHWQSKKMPSNYSFLDIYFANENYGWLLCERVSPQNYANRTPCLLESNNGGETWEEQDLPESSLRLSRIVPLGLAKLAIVGESGRMLIFNLRKREWEIGMNGLKGRLTAGHSSTDSTTIIVGRGGIVLKTNDEGKQWKVLTAPFDDGTAGFSGVFLNRETAWMVGINGQIFAMKDDGTAWQRQQSGVTSDLADICFIDRQVGFIVGDKGVILQTTDGGLNWQLINGLTTHRLERIACKHGTATAVGFGGVLLQYRKNS